MWCVIGSNLWVVLVVLILCVWWKNSWVLINFLSLVISWEIDGWVMLIVLVVWCMLFSLVIFSKIFMWWNLVLVIKCCSKVGEFVFM